MKHKKILAATLAVALSITAGFSLAACNKAVSYEFEAESAVFTNGIATQYGQDGMPTQGPANITVEEGNEYSADENVEGPEVTNIGYFYGEGTKITWTIIAEADCTGTLKLRAATPLDFMGMFSGGQAMPDVDLSQNAYVKLVVNDEDVQLTGTLKGIEDLGFESMADPSIYKNFSWSDGVSVKLKAGENKVELVCTNPSGGLNIDKISISAATKLSYTPVEN